MPVEAPYPSVEDLMGLIGEAGLRLAEIEASEGAAGNISVYIGWHVRRPVSFSKVEIEPLPQPVPELAGATFLVTGSGRRLREIGKDPEANLGIVSVNADGTTAKLFSSPRRLFARLTSEFNSHLAVHQDQIVRTGTNFHALIHAQPLHLTYLSHIPAYQDTVGLNRRILRWQPECIVHLPEGVGFIPFLIPGSAELMAVNVEMLRTHRVVLWGKHGVMARSDASVKRACDRIEYAEVGARYEYLNLTTQGQGQGLSVSDIRAICNAFQIEQGIF